MVKKHIESKDYSIVFMNMGCEIFSKVQRMCKKNNVKLYIDQCEWMDLSSYRFGRFDLRFLCAKRIREKSCKTVSGIISISQLLDNHYKKLGCRSLRIPTILNVSETEYKTENSNRFINLIFAGSLGGTKELLEPIFLSLKENPAFHNRIHLNIYGPSEQDTLKNIGMNNNLLESVRKCITFFGHVSQDKISSLFLESTFLIFIRPERQSSNAGFPTKLAESMSTGTPVITNDTGDIGLYLKNGLNGYLLKDNSKESITECFEKILTLSNQEYNKMRVNARVTAENYFDYKQYINEVSYFFSQ